MIKKLTTLGLILLSVGMLSACSGTTKIMHAHQTKSTKSDHPSKKQTKQQVVKGLTKLSEVSAHYDNVIGNDGYLVQADMDAETIGNVQQMIKGNITDVKGDFDTKYKDGIRLIKQADIDSTITHRYLSDTKDMHGYEDDWVTALQNLNESNTNETFNTLQNGQSEYLSASNSVGQESIYLLMDAGYSEKAAQNKFEQIVIDATKKYGDPTDVIKMEQQSN